MHRPRFVFLATGIADGRPGTTPPAEGHVWLLMSSNNRRLGRSPTTFDTYTGCRAAVDRLQREHARVQPQAVADDATGRFAWRVDLDGETVAVSSRSYLRARECDYSLARFLESVPTAAVVNGARQVRRGRRYRPDRPAQSEVDGAR